MRLRSRHLLQGIVAVSVVLLLVPAAAASVAATPSSRDTSSRAASSKPTSSRNMSSSRATGARRTHIVRSGDTVASIAKAYGVSARSVRVANGIVDDRLYRGARLVIDGTAASTGGLSVGSAGVMGPKLRCPVPGATFMNDWGFPRDDGGRFHEGTDMFARRGATVYAPASGTVLFGSNHLGGTTFNLTTSSGWVIYGAHLSATIGSSRHVRAGEPIARVGSSGNAAGGDAHLHVGLRRWGSRSINPYPSMRAACG